MTTKIAIASYKGGVAKTQTAFELVWWLAKHGAKVLAIDTDSQANLTELLLNGNEAVGRPLPDILISGQPITKEDINTRIIDDNHQIDFVASNIGLGRIEGRIVSESPKEYIMADIIKDISSQYNYIVFDTAPSAELLGISTLLAAEDVIVPTSLDKLSIDGMGEMVKMVERIKLNPRLNPYINLCGIIVTRYRRTLSTMFHGNDIQSRFPDYVIKTFVRESTKVQQASNSCQTIQEYDSSNNAAKDYDAAFHEIFPGFKD